MRKARRRGRGRVEGQGGERGRERNISLERDTSTGFLQHGPDMEQGVNPPLMYELLTTNGT